MSAQLNGKFESTSAVTIMEFAQQENMERTYLGDLLKLKYLSPEIVSLIFKGQSPMHLNASKLMRIKLPRCWQGQKEMLGLI